MSSTVVNVSFFLSFAFSSRRSDQIFEVKMISVFLKSTVFHLLSVSLQSSRTWSKTLKTSGWAFSTSSNRITAYGFLLTASVNCPHSS